MPSFRAAALTDIGRVRHENEDRFVCDLELQVFGVADGVGGLPGGSEAAELAMKEVTTALALPPNRHDPNLAQIVQQANVTVGGLGLKMSPSLGIGTTLTIGCIRNRALKLAHVGDSRAYVAHERKFVRLTEDHSVENEARLRRARGEVVYYHEANRQALTRCIGQPGRVDVDLISRPLSQGDRYLFCTDGVTRMIPDGELGTIVLKHKDPAEGVRELVNLAVERGGPDNATAVLLYVDQIE